MFRRYIQLVGIGGRVGSIESFSFGMVGFDDEVVSVGIVGSGVVGGFGGTGLGSEPEELKAPSSPSITNSNIRTATIIMAAHITFFLLALRW